MMASWPAWSRWVRPYPGLPAGLGTDGVLECVVEDLERGVEPLLSRRVVFVVGLGGDVAEQLIEIIFAAVQDDHAVVRDGCPEHDPLAGVVEQGEAAKRVDHL